MVFALRILGIIFIRLDAGFIYVEFSLSICELSSIADKDSQKLIVHCLAVVLFTRTYAVWGRSRYIFVLLAFIYIVRFSFLASRPM